MKWISVKDKLPETNKRVLLMFEDESVCTGAYERVRKEGELYWNRESVRKDRNIENAQYWMELPTLDTHRVEHLEEGPGESIGKSKVLRFIYYMQAFEDRKEIFLQEFGERLFNENQTAPTEDDEWYNEMFECLDKIRYLSFKKDGAKINELFDKALSAYRKCSFYSEYTENIIMCGMTDIIWENE